MDLTEFLQHTDHRNFIHNINYMVTQRMREYEKELNTKRKRLKALLAYENRLFEEELVLLYQRQKEENQHKRLEWINQMNLDQKMAEAEFLRAKQQQREMERSEAVRLWETKELLLETKQAQLYQIAEKKTLQQKQQSEDDNWWRVQCRMNADLTKRDEFEKKLQRVIARLNESRNLEQEAAQKAQSKTELEAHKQAHMIDDKAALAVDWRQKETEKLRQMMQKVQYHDMLQLNIAERALRANVSKERELAEDLHRTALINEISKLAVDREDRQKVRERVCQDGFLQQALHEKLLQRGRDQDLERAYHGTGCVLAQRPKRPYNHLSR